MKKPIEKLKRSKAWADAISKGKKGHKHSEETKRKIGIRSANRSKEVLNKISKTLTGRKRTQEEKDKIKKSNVKYWLGKKRPNISGKNNYNWGGGKPGCIDCGKQVEYETIRCKKCFGLFNKAENHYNWNGGITPFRVKVYTSKEYQYWRTSVFERDNYTCIWCGARSGNGKAVKLNADHIKPFCDYPELRFAIDNGRTLCWDCHKTTDTFAGRIISYRKNNGRQ